MLDRIRARLTYANVMSSIAVFGLLAGGGAYAASKIGPRDIKKNAVRAKHVKKNQIRAKHIKKRQVRRKHIKNGAVTEAKLAEGVIGSGPAGPRGPAGPQGEGGPAGPQGASAFEVDCNEGLPAGDVMIRVGATCIDKYEASIWDAPTGGNQITGALPCNANGQDCKGKIFARSVAGVEPRRDITWFQAQQALANSGKRLPTNAEWQMAVAGTPDSSACNVSGPVPVNTGANANCKSAHGANDMVGNLWEWVADWDEEAASCANWPADFGSDLACVGRGSGEASTRVPGALVRGGSRFNGANAGPFAVSGDRRPSESSALFGFRGAR